MCKAGPCFWRGAMIWWANSSLVGSLEYVCCSSSLSAIQPFVKYQPETSGCSSVRWTSQGPTPLFLSATLLGSLVLQAQVSWWVPGTSKHPTCRQVPADSKHAIPMAQGQQWPYRQAAASRLGWQGHAGGAHPPVSSVLLWEAPSCRACRAVWEWTMYLIPPFWSSFIYPCSSPGCSHCSVSLRLFLVQTPYSLFKYKKRVCAHSCQLALETLSTSFCAPEPWILSMLLD